VSSAIDPISLEILSNALRSVADETYIALMKSAYSTNIKERHDHSTAIIDPRGRLIVQAENSLAIHLGSMMGLMQTLLAKIPLSEIKDGDIFAGNDPFVAGGSHLPDVNLAMPVFYGGRLISFVCNIAHHADIGGMAPGSMAGGMTEIYQEGLRIPLVRLFREGRLVEDVLDILLLNARVPEERRGDYFAQIAACRLGVRRMIEIIEARGSDLTAAFDEIIARTEARLRSALSGVAPGEYCFEDVMDDDGLGTTDIPIRLRIKVPEAGSPQRLLFDFTGTGAQVKGNINATITATQAGVLYAVKALFDPDAPNNQGLINTVDILAPEGTLVNARFPAAVAARANSAQRIVDVVIGALAPAVPQAAVAAANGANTTAVFFGRDPRRDRDYVYLETLGGGFGGRSSKDGKDGVQVHITNTSNLPIEAIEMEYPLMVESYGFIVDSGGPGKHRGGLGLRRVVRPVDHAMIFNGQGERFSNHPWGIFGGGEGATGRFLKRTPQGEQALPSKPMSVAVAADEAIVIETPGAGGYGAGRERTRAALHQDYRSGKFTRAFLQRHYGIDPHEDGDAPQSFHCVEAAGGDGEQ
jgi:N-methylhydantoinase B